jgi:hypothetical protein
LRELCRKKYETPAAPGFLCFAGVFEGYFGKNGALGWFFDGVFVVNCMVNVDRKRSLIRPQKMRHASEVYFWPISFEGSCARLGTV